MLFVVSIAPFNSVSTACKRDSIPLTVSFVAKFDVSGISDLSANVSLSAVYAVTSTLSFNDSDNSDSVIYSSGIEVK